MGAAALALLRRFWPYLLGAAALIALWIAWGAYLDHVRTLQRDKDLAAYTAAQGRAAVIAKQEADAKDAAYAKITADKDKEYVQAIDTAHAAVAAYAQRMRANAARSAGGTDLPAPPTVAEVDNGPGEGALVPTPLGDLGVCAEAVTRLQNARAWGEGLIETEK